MWTSNQQKALDHLATAPSLLVVSDFDGTLAGFSHDAMQVPVNHVAMAALQQLTSLPRTWVALLSGRDVQGLIQVSGAAAPMIVAGSHGAESTEGGLVLNEAQQTALSTVTTALEKIAASVPGAFVELKPYHRVLHVIRVADKQQARTALDRALALEIPGAKLAEGKWIAEASVVDFTKGTWITSAQEQYRPSATLFLGDDTTDENGFAALGSQDVGIKVGAGDTCATVRLESIDRVGQFLSSLAAARSVAQQ
ncbi:trehalose-phosphatase [Corynebacterium rouxii]|uniref:Trehalose 6-phosphate phosphatase n=1 Tax=Corynebacterium rouxii TaxID=2719119 RepID=A0ABU3PPH7_9CORY|nr:trehalose-phosphatase [Corynebacterium rouxii]MDT9409500.1 trehalose-phosphatase [Corynebacterium rouxii]MDT9411733.1 trehalose-phosphatase [Corynebacterium rouxii]